MDETTAEEKKIPLVESQPSLAKEAPFLVETAAEDTNMISFPSILLAECSAKAASLAKLLQKRDGTLPDKEKLKEYSVNKDDLVRLAVLLEQKKYSIAHEDIPEMEDFFREDENEDILIKSLCESSSPEQKCLELTLLQVMAAHRFMVAAKRLSLDKLVAEIGFGNLEKAHSCSSNSSKLFLFLEANALTKQNESRTFMEIALALSNKERLILCGLAALLDATKNMLDSEMDSEELFLEAVREGDLERVCQLVQEDQEDGTNWLVENGARLYTDGETPLHIACKHCHFPIIEYLVQEGANVNASGRDEGITPLYYACNSGPLRVVELLVEKGAHVDGLGNFRTPAQWACRAGHVDILRYLMQQGASVNDHRRAQWAALEQACSNGQLSIVRFLAEEHGADLFDTERFEPYCFSLLFFASIGGHIPVVEYLMEKGSSVHQRSFDGKTALSLACREGHLPVVQFLFGKGADINTQDSKGNTPFHKACANGHLPVVRFLMQQGVAMNTRNEKGETALQWAFKATDNEDVVRYLELNQRYAMVRLFLGLDI